MNRLSLVFFSCLLCLGNAALATEIIDCPERYPNGNRLIDGEVLRYPNGNRIKDDAVWRYPGGNRVVDGEVWRYQNGNRLIDESAVWRYEGGNRLKDGDVIRYQNGNRLRDPDGVFRDANGSRTSEASRRFTYPASDGTLIQVHVAKNREVLEVIINYDAEHHFVLRYEGGADYQPASLRCDVPPPGNTPAREFMINERPATVRVLVNEGFDPKKIREAVSRVLRELE